MSSATGEEKSAELEKAAVPATKAQKESKTKSALEETVSLLA